jgi:hypothetical protein
VNGIKFPAWIKAVFLFCCFTILAASLLHAQIITTYAGSGAIGGCCGSFTGDGGPATAATLWGPSGVTIDSAGNVYIVDENNFRIRKVSPTGIISTIAGDGLTVYLGDGIAATATGMMPTRIAVDGVGNVYIIDGPYYMRKIDTAGIITTIAGDGTTGYSGDGGVATDAEIQVNDVASDKAGNLYLSCGTRIRKISTSGVITTVAGNGTPGHLGDGGPATAAEFIITFGISIDGAGNLYIDEVTYIRKVDTAGIITTIAGNGIIGFAGDGDPATTAEFAAPKGLTTDNYGNVYIADQNNDRIRCVSATGVITTVAGNGYEATTTGGFSGDGGPADSAALWHPVGITYGANGAIYFSDVGNNRIRKITLPAIAVNCAPGDTVCAGDTVIFTATVTNDTAIIFYQWQLNGASVGTDTSAYITDTLHNGDVVNCLLTYTYGDTITTGSNIIIMSVDDAGALTGPDTVCIGDTITLAHTAIGGLWSGSNTHAVAIGAMVTGISEGVDTIRYSITNSCGSDTATHIVTINNCTAGVRNIAGAGKEAINIYPNPNNGIFTFYLSSNTTEEAHIVITNIMGATIKEMTTNTNATIEIQLDVPAGVYFLNAVTKEGEYNKKIIVEK